MNYVGIDIGSTASKVVVEGDKKEHFVLPTGWSSKETCEKIKNKLLEMGVDVTSDDTKVVATGYGRIAVDFADHVITEITILGLEAVAAEPKVAVVRCNGSCENRPRTALYDGAKSCAIAHATSGGETGCTFGCLGCGDCVEACQFDAIHMNPETGLPEVDEEKCTACGACSKACPRKIIEIRPKGKNNRRVVVMCVNKDKGAVANKACKASCIGCGKCVKVCPFEAITLENNLAYIDPAKCKSCRKCESECPKGAIQAINFPPRKPKVEVPAGEAAAKPAVKVEASKVETPKAEAVKAEAPKTEA